MIVAATLASLGCKSVERKVTRAGPDSGPTSAQLPPTPRPAAVADAAAPPVSLGDPVTRAELQLAQGNPIGVLELLEPIVKANPEAASAWEILGEAYRQLGRREDALRAFGETLRREPASVGARVGTCRIRADRGEARPAVAACRQALEVAPQDVDMRFALGISLMQDGQGDEAARELERVVKLRPKVADVRVPLGRSYLFLKRYQDARRELTEALRLEPGRTLAKDLLARTLFELGEAAEAAKLWREVVSAEPGNTEARRGIVGAQRKSGASKEAAEELRGLLEKSPENLQLRLELASTQIEARDWRGAVETLEEILRRQPDHVAALHNLGVVQERLGNPELATDAYRRELALAPERSDTRLHYANLLERQGKLREALAAYEVYRRLSGAAGAQAAQEAIARVKRALAP
jgi:tetratricopeptide (TPR) repeat protein